MKKYIIGGVLILGLVGIVLLAKMGGPGEKLFDENWIKDEGFGYIDSITEKEGEYVAKIDLAKWYEGDEAIRAAKEDGNPVAPAGFYVRNNSMEYFEYTFSSNAKVSVDVTDRSVYPFVEKSEEMSALQFIAAWESWAPEDVRRLMPFHIKQSGENILELRQQFLP